MAQDDWVPMGRYMNWKNDPANINDDGPSPIASMYATPNNLQGYFDQMFTVPLLYDDRMVSNNWDDALLDASDTWNAVSNLIKTSMDPLGITVTSYGFEYPQRNTVSSSEDLLIPEFSPGSTVLAIAKIYYYPGTDSDPCGMVSINSEPVNTGPIIVGGDIIFNHHKEWFEGDLGLATEYSVKFIGAHEIGHVMGLNHHTGSSRSRIMHKSSTTNTIHSPAPDDITAINTLYGFDGVLGDFSNPFYNSIPCGDFQTSIVEGIIGLGIDGDDPPPSFFSNDPCNNCFRDPNENGLDCGGGGCGPCESRCTGSIDYFNAFWTETRIPAYNVVQKDINIVPANGDIRVKSGVFKYFQAGEKIEIKPLTPTSSVTVEYNGNAEFKIDQCECPPICLLFLPNIITPNCDGINDWLSFVVNGAETYEITIKNRNGGQVYHHNGPVDSPNEIFAWNGLVNGSGSPVSDGVYFYTLTLRNSCGATSLVASDHLTVKEAKSCMEGQNPPVFMVLPNDEDNNYLPPPYTTDSKEKKHKFGSTSTEIVLYPNPFSRRFTIQSPFTIYSVKIINESGTPVYISDNIESQKVEIDLYNTNLSPGPYVVIISSEEGVTYKKIIKQ